MFIKYDKNPVVKREKNTFYSKHAANPDILKINQKMIMYFRGQGENSHDQIGILYQEESEFDGVNFNLYGNEPIIKVSDDDKAFDNRHILDPAACIYKNTVYLYYSCHSYTRSACVGLAISKDGFSFKKNRRPIIENAIAPEVVVYNNMIHLFYQRKVGQVFKFYVSVSIDGVNFENEKLVFESNRKKEALDSFSVSTGRIIKEEEYFYLVYGGCQHFIDYPESFLIARSSNLTSWERASNSVILSRGEAGSFDEGAIWFPTVYKHKNLYYLWYEGTGSSKNNKEISAIIRNSNYGLYAKESFSQIGLATYKGRLADFFVQTDL